eukprot:UN02338
MGAALDIIVTITGVLSCVFTLLIGSFLLVVGAILTIQFSFTGVLLYIVMCGGIYVFLGVVAALKKIFFCGKHLVHLIVLALTLILSGFLFIYVTFYKTKFLTAIERFDIWVEFQGRKTDIIKFSNYVNTYQPYISLGFGVFCGLLLLTLILVGVKQVLTADKDSHSVVPLE